jgi:hypothetical protein
MNVFSTTPEQGLKAARYAVRMENEGHPSEFVSRVLRLAQSDQGVFELMELWAEADAQEERDKLVVALEEAIADEGDLQDGTQRRPKIPFDTFDEVTRRILEHKRRLRELIDRHGGVSEVARKSGIPQPSLSRMLSSGSMPRRTTLYRIARALDVAESEIVGEFVK